MARTLAGFSAAALGLGAVAVLAQAHPLETSLERAQAMLIKEDLGGGVYVFRAPSDLDYWTATNSTVIVNDEDVTVFDSCTRAVTAQAVIAEIRKLTSKPVRVLINSHWHQDHWSGNDAYSKAFPGIRIISTVETRDFMSHMGPAFFIDELESFGLTKMREDLAAGIKTGKLPDGSPFTDAVRARKEASVQMATQFQNEIAALPRVVPNFVYRGEMTFWSGRREFRLMSVTGDAPYSTVLYLPGSKILVMGDVLVSPEDGKGAPPWSTGAPAPTAWLESLRRLDALDLKTIVPGQGPVMHDKVYLRQTIKIFATVIDQIHAAVDRGLVRLSQVQPAVNVDKLGQEYAPGAPLDEYFPLVISGFTKKALQETLGFGANDK